MYNSDEEFIMDFKAEEKRPQMTIFDTEDSITISASEADYDGYNSPTPPLFCKLKKARVLIRKLPRDVLAKYNMKRKKSSSSRAIPFRSSGRLKDKQVPFGQYLALHVNKPLSEILNKKKRLTTQQIKSMEYEKQRKLIQNKKRIELSTKPTHSRLTRLSEKMSIPNTSTPAKINLHEKMQERNQVKTKQIIAATLPKTPAINGTTQISLSDDRSLLKKQSPTRLRNTHVTSTLPNCPDVVITRYNLPSTTQSNIQNPINLNAPVNVPPTPQSNIQNPIILNAPVNVPPTPQSNIQNPIILNAAVNVPLTTGANNYLQNSINFYNSQGIQTHSMYPMQCHSMGFNPVATASNLNFPPPNNSMSRTFTIQAFKVPHNLSSVNSPLAVPSPNVLIIKQPFVRNDPLETSNFKTTDVVLTPQQPPEENHSDSDTITCNESESDLELPDSENQNEPEVIKRIIYHTKSVQTKFTCNSSICGLIDSDEFNLNCFYCYDIFPLHKWFEFKEHIKHVHHAEEKQNKSDLDAGISNYKSETYHQINASQPNINLSKIGNPITKSTSNNVITLNKENFLTKRSNTGNQVPKKLPLEPRLMAERANKMYTGKVKQLPLPSTPKTVCYPAKQKKSVVSGQLPKRNLSKNNDKINIDQIICLDSDDGDLGTDGFDHVTKTTGRDKGTATNQSNSNNGVNDVSIVLPSLPHLTIKKVFRTLPKKSINSQSQKPATKSTSFNEPFVKVPSNMNIRRVIKTLPKTTGQQLGDNGRTKPRYFVVKKIIKLPSTGTPPRLNISQGMVLKKVQDSGKDNTKKIEYDYMPSNDDNEDPVPKPTRGAGIIFGVTNSTVVTEFLLKLKTFPELWRSLLINSLSSNFDESIRKLCLHLNSRFQLHITEIEIRRSIQRIKDWYYRTLKNVNEHNKNPSNNEPYKHNFPKYFEILQKFLIPDNQDANTILKGQQVKSDKNMYNAMACDTATLTPVPLFKATQPVTSSSNTPSVASTNKIDNESTDKSGESLIEFDADTLYDNESSDEEVLEAFDETKILRKKAVPKCDGQKKKTKIYRGSFECDICKKIFKRRCDLKRHKVYHFPPQIECGTCSQKFHFKHFADKCSHIKNVIKYQRVEKNAAADSAEARRIWPKKIFRFYLICEICGASYRSIGSLNTHKRDKHLNQRDKCVVCNFTALSNWRIVQHQKKRHIVEPGTVEEIAKKSRARTDSKTPFSNEARQGFDWRREMRKKLKPGEKFFGCCRCKIIFNSRKEKVLHNKTEHPITEFTVICLLCLPNTKFLLSNSNSVRRHYTDIHKVAWHEIDELVKRTKPIFDLLSKDEIELLKASSNYKELLEELLKDKKLEPAKNVQRLEDETLQAVENLPTSPHSIKDEEFNKIDVECRQEENVYVDGIIDHDYNCEVIFSEHEYASRNDHNYNEEIVENNNDYDGVKTEVYSQNICDYGTDRLSCDTESNGNTTDAFIQDNQDYVQSIVDDLAEGELVEESLVVEEYIDELIDEEDQKDF